MTALDTAAHTLHHDPNLGVLGVYAAAAGDPLVWVHGVLTINDSPVDYGGEGRARHQGYRLDLLRAEVPVRPTTTARVVLDATTYAVRDVEADEEGTVWRCDVYPVPG